MNLVIFGDSYACNTKELINNKKVHPNAHDWYWPTQLTKHYDKVKNLGVSGSGADSISRSAAKFLQTADASKWHCVYIVSYTHRLHYDWMTHSNQDILTVTNAGPHNLKLYPPGVANRARVMHKHFETEQSQRLQNPVFKSLETERYVLQAQHVIKRFASGVVFSVEEDPTHTTPIHAGLFWHSRGEGLAKGKNGWDDRPGHFRKPNHAVMRDIVLHHLGHDVAEPKRFHVLHPECSVIQDRSSQDSRLRSRDFSR